MRLKDCLLLMAVCFVWALNIIVGKIMFVSYHIPPFYYAGIRFLGVTLLLWPLLRPLPKQWAAILLVGLLVGAAHFGLLFVGLQNTSPSAASIVLQFGVPFTMVLSVFFLGEKMSLRRFVGLILAMCGVIAVIWNPEANFFSLGLILVLLSTMSIAIGTIILKRLTPIKPLRLQAWVAVVSTLPLLLISIGYEEQQWEISVAAGWPFLAAVIFSVVLVTIVAHTLYFHLVQTYEASVVAPMLLAMPIMAIFLGVMFTGDELTAMIMLGSVMCLGGVALIVTERAKRKR